MTRAQPRRTHRIDVGDLAFRVIADGETREGRTPVVVVHGIGMSGRYWSRLRAALGPHANVVALDLPGFAGLPTPARPVDVVTMASALAEVVSTLELGPALIVGHSMGAQWVVELAVQRPELVSRVVVIGPVTDAAHRSVGAQMRALALDTLGELPTTNWIVATDYIRCGIPWYLAQLGPMLTFPLEERVAALTVPLLIIRGGRDPIAGLSWCRLLRDRAPDAALVQIPGRCHAVHHSAPRAVAAAIRAHASGA